MATAQIGKLRQMFDRVRGDADGGDGELLTRYRTMRDQDAFGSLVRRHAPMVLGVCRRVLRDTHAADDAFQATFLVLAKKADAVRPPDRLAPWLYGVAYRTALKARGRAFRRHQVELDYATNATRAVHDSREIDLDDPRPVIDEQLNSLPEKYRAPLVLCALEGLNKAQAAQRLGLPEGTVSSRLARAREMLRDRLARRGVVVPATAFAALLTADSLQAAVSPALAASAMSVTGSTTAIPATVLTLSHEVIRSMTLSKLKFFGAIALSVSLAGGGFGLVALQANDKKPVQQGEKPVVQAEKPKPDQPKPDKPKPEGEKPQKPAATRGGKVAGVDAKENTITLAFKGDGGVVEKLVKVAPTAKVFIDGKEAKLADVPKNSTATFLAQGTKEGALPEATELRVTGSTVSGPVKQLDAKSVTVSSEKADRVFTLAPGGKVTINGKGATIANLTVGDRVTITLTADEQSALSISTGTRPDGEKPANKPARFGGKIATVDADTRIVTLIAKNESGKPLVVKITPDAKITVDGKETKIVDLPKGAAATFVLSSAKDGQPRESNEVVIAGPTYSGAIKQVDETSITIGVKSEKPGGGDRVIKLAPGGKVMIGEKEVKLAELQVGQSVTVVLNSSESGAISITVGAKKPKPDKEEDDQ